MLLWIVAALAQERVEAPVEVTPDVVEASHPVLKLVYTGASGGVAAGHFDARLFTEVVDELGLQVDAVQAAHGMFVQGDFALSTPSRTVRSGSEFLSAPITCEAPVKVSTIWTPLGAVFLPGPPVPGPTALRRTCTNEAGLTATLFGVTDGLPESWLPEDFELRLGLWAETPKGTLLLIGRSRHEPARRFSLLSQQLSEGALWVDVGDFVDGASTVKDDGLSLHRATGFEALRRLKPTALVPGENELAAGPQIFLSESTGLPYVVSNWKSEEYPLPQVITVDSEGKTIAFVGVLDPSTVLVGPGASKVTLTEPRDALRQVLEGVDADLIVLLTLADVDTSDLGIDLVVGELARRGRTESIVWKRGPGGRLDADLGLTLPIDAVSTVEVDWDAETVTVLPLRLQASILPDRIIQRAVTKVRLAYYPSLEDELLPAHPQHPTEPITASEFGQITCEALRSYADADVVLLGVVPKAASVPGGITGLLTLDQLPARDRVELHWVTGARMRRLLTQAYGMVPVSCGSQLGVRFPKARGRPLDDARLYRVVTTDRSRLDPVLDGLFSEARSPLLLDRKQRLMSVHGKSLTLREAVFSTLRQLQRAPESSPWDLLKRSADKPPMWVLDVGSVAVRVERFQGVEDAVYASIPETLATSPSSFTVGGNIDVELSYSSRSWLTDFRLVSAYTRLATQSAVQETADDLKISADGVLPAAGFSAGAHWMPFGELLIDSEFTPAEPEEGALAIPRQGDLYVLSGLSARRQGMLRRLRFGGFMLRDLSTLAKPMEFGGRVDGQLRFTLGPALYWTNGLDAYFYASTSQDDASDLRFKATLNSRLSLPLARWLSVSLYGQGFAFSGRVPQTAQVAVSYTTGASLDLSGAFELR